MRSSTLARLIALSLATTLATQTAHGQGTPADYLRSDSLHARFQDKLVDVVEGTTWIDSSRFWYRKAVAGGTEFMFVNARTLEKRPAFDHAKLAAALSKAESLSVKSQISPLKLPFQTFTYADSDRKISFTAAPSIWECMLTDYVCRRTGAAPAAGRGGRGGGGGGGGGGAASDDPNSDAIGDQSQATEPPPFEGPWPEDGETTYGGLVLDQQQQQGRGGCQITRCPSPDGKLEAYLENNDVFIRPAGAASGTPLTDDGTPTRTYGPLGGGGRGGAFVWWSPDSKKIVAYRSTSGTDRRIHYVLSSPRDQFQPRDTVGVRYQKPGDVVDYKRPVLIDVATKRVTPIDESLFPNPYNISNPVWWRDSRAFTFNDNERGHQVYRVIEVDGTTGKARALISEASKTFIYYNPLPGGTANATQTSYFSDAGRHYRHDMADGKEIIWMSERDGWAHLYLYDGITGTLKNQITKGNFVVRSVERVDEQERQIWFTASGMNAGQDPYVLQFYRINFDGTGLTALTNADGNHWLTWSPNRGYYIDTYSRVDAAPVSQLRRTSDQKVVMDLERGSTADLVKAGWSAPEVFVAKGRDGTTDIWGVIFKPTNFNPRKKYPVIENIYAGPQGSFVPKTFSVDNGMRNLAELGFIVVQIDGMGTANRSKAFHDVAWKNLGDAGFPDRILWHKAVAAKYPWYDITRVGIYGTSAGGQNAMGALLFHPEFYKVSYSASGCHDNRMDKIWWNEQWMGWPLGPQYDSSSNMTNAYRLQGKLMLVFGEYDTNVDPSSTLQVVNQLILNNKMFDLLEIPNSDHTSGGAYGDKKRNDFFVHNLLGVEPANRNTAPATSTGGRGGGRGGRGGGPGGQ